MSKLLPLLVLIFTLCLLPTKASAVSTSHWTQSTEADFKAGTLHNVVATNLSDVKLSRELKTLMEEDPQVSSVTALAQAKDGTIFVGTAPKGLLLKITDGKVSSAATIEDTVSINALTFDGDGSLLIATGGAAGQVLRIDKPGDKPRVIFAEKDVQYVWALVAMPDGMIYAATGPNGQLFSIAPDGTHTEIYKSDETNFTTLISDGKDLLYLGTDPDGLVVRFNRKTKESFVVFNAGEEVITALALDAKGNLFAATGQSPAEPQQNQPPTDADAKETNGRPEATPGNAPALPSQPPTAPKPPQAPNPNPGEPAPIPKKVGASRPTALRAHIAHHAPLMLTTRGGNKQQEDPQPPDGDPGAPDQPQNPGQPGSANGNGDQNAPGAKKPDKDAKDAQAAPDQNKPEGNGVYKIDPDGFVTEVFRQNVVIFSLVNQDDALLVGTGNDGLVYQITPDSEETVVVAKTDAKQVTAMLVASDGRTLLGLSNSGGVAAMNKGFAALGTYTSPVLDATQVSRFGAMQLHGYLPTGTRLTVATRSGNLKDEDAQGWSPWTSEIPATQFLKVVAPPARFLQYRITFNSKDGTQTPVIKDVDVAYQMPNLAPVIKAVKVSTATPAAPQGGQNGPAAPSAKPGADEPKPTGTGVQTITWDASDANNDALVYSLYFRSTSAGPWILLKDKLTDPTFAWDTKTVADGRYEIKVAASDAAANPVGQGKTATRISDTVVVDNTPPTIGDLVVKAAGNSVKIDLRVTDATSTVASMEYSIDSSDTWQTVLPVDNIFDSPEETVAMTIDGVSAGAHQIAIRTSDDKGNVALQTVSVTVDAGK